MPRYRSAAIALRLSGWLSLPLLGLGCGLKSLLYPIPAVPLGDPPAGCESVELSLSDGDTTVAWSCDQPSAAPVLVYFHGNGENLETLRAWGLYDRLRVLGAPVVVEYPGYGGTSGRPSEARLKEAADRTLSWVRSRWPDRPVVAVGWSLGAAVAIHLAATRPDDLDGLVALSPWTSLQEVARSHFPSWLVAVGLRESYDSLALAPAIDCPVLIAHGHRDAIIPIRQAERLAAALPAARWLPVESAGHNDLLSEASVWREIDGFLAPLSRGRGPVK